jgi:hypothetical protein
MSGSCKVLLPGQAIAQAVSRRLPTAAARFRDQVKSYGIYGGQSGAGAGFLRVLLFPLLHTHHRLPFQTGTVDQIVPNLSSGLSLTTPRETKESTSTAFYQTLIALAIHYSDSTSWSAQITRLLVMCYDNIKKDFVEIVRMRGDWN